MKLQGKTIVITGTSAGMGKSIAELFVKEGANVIAVARRKERLDALAESLAGEAGRIIPFVGDVSKLADCEAMIDLAVEKFGRLDVLVNNAGIMDNMASAADFTQEKLDSVYAVNVYGPLYAMRKAVNVFLAQGDGGNIITVTSVGGSHQCAGIVYASSKAAVNAMVRHVAFTYRHEKIRSNAIAPGGIDTEITSTMVNLSPDGYGRVQPVLGLGVENGAGADIANAALYLASDDSRYVSGNIFAVDGGWTAF